MRRNFLSLFLLWSLCFAVFSPSLSGDFVRDDEADIVGNPAIGAFRSWPRLLTAAGNTGILVGVMTRVLGWGRQGEGALRRE